MRMRGRRYIGHCGDCGSHWTAPDPTSLHNILMHHRDHCRQDWDVAVAAGRSRTKTSWKCGICNTTIRHFKRSRFLLAAVQSHVEMHAERLRMGKKGRCGACGSAQAV